MNLIWKLAFVPLVFSAAAAAQPSQPEVGHYCLRTDIMTADEDDEEEALEQMAFEFRADAPQTEPDSLEKMGDNELAESFGLALLGVDVQVESVSGEPHVTFSTYMPDYRQTVSAGPAPSRVLPNGALEFAFVDNWDAPGRGTLTPEGDGLVLKVSRTGESPSFAGRFAARQYGEFKVRPGQCAPNR